MTPLLRNGYHVALLVGAGVVALAAVAAAALRQRFPHDLGTPTTNLSQTKKIRHDKH
ncbi:hypothetical protein [Amycolatopsis mediterranei]|uniref:Uncharacterized protein n=1 Tax=Amycolatopsis mediterranei (strain S699) TaxID=713604 RepID=A0A9R0P5C0_AMYMS|nr:hypothetical protein [Amycolatopsis mediterranei]AEK46492.1 hypothetical protein RAM_40125 [Amycolatopsis mediterranei S699]UZF74531.1 hypothetical protein ISP_008055 [Amycolatopsis mediterranei]